MEEMRDRGETIRDEQEDKERRLILSCQITDNGGEEDGKKQR